jgi:hypothetical protein
MMSLISFPNGGAIAIGHEPLEGRLQGIRYVVVACALPVVWARRPYSRSPEGDSSHLGRQGECDAPSPSEAR